VDAFVRFLNLYSVKESQKRPLDACVMFLTEKVIIGILVGIVESSEYYCTFEQKRLKNYRKGNFNNL
jgi:hypothetical protein